MAYHHHHHHQSNSFINLRFCFILLCISMIIIQVSQASNDDFSSSMEDEQEISRRDSKKVAQMLQQILQRGEMQVEPYRIHKFLGRLNRRRTNEQIKHAMNHYF